MRTPALIAMIGLALAGASAVQAKPKQTGEERLAKLLEGRVAGQPVSCISLHQTRDTRVIDKTAIVYKSGSTIWVNRPSNPQSLDDDDVLVTELRGSQLCRMDIVRTHDRTAHFYTGFVGLQDFVPYRKVAVKD